MADEIYTLWRVKDGRQTEFIAAWQALGRYLVVGQFEECHGARIARRVSRTRR